MFYATKYIKTDYKDGIATNINEYKFISDVTYEDIEFLEDKFGVNGLANDYEEANSNGIIYNYNDIDHIDVDKIMECIEEYLESDYFDDEDEETQEWLKETLTKITTKLEKYEGYIIHYDFVPDALRSDYENGLAELRESRGD